jgi:hypothetical protein
MQRVYRFYDFSKALLIEPNGAYYMAGAVKRTARPQFVIESARTDTKHAWRSTAPAHADGAGGSPTR